ncbi:MAG TPA: Ku protein, partial [Terracidiphilus sp.]
MPRPFWSGQIQISLVAFGVKLFLATEAKSEIHFHEIDRRTGTRVRHQKVSESDEEPVAKDDIVKGYEYRKGQYVQIDPKEIEHLRIPSKHTLQMEQFVDPDQLDPAHFEKPYFVVPDKDSQAEAFAVVREALKETHRAGLGKIAMGGREHLVAICAPSDPKLPGLMAYTLRYADELRSASEYFSDVKTPKIDAEQLSLAKELIQRKAAKFDPSKFTDNYEAALRELVKAKMKHLPLPLEEKPAPRAKVINLMDALRRSVKSPDEKKPPAHSGTHKASGARRAQSSRHGLRLLKSGAK